MSWQGWSRRSLSWLLIVSLAFNIGVCSTLGVLAYREHDVLARDGGRRPGPHGLGFLEDLNLTAEQVAQMKTAKEGMSEVIHALRRELKRNHEVLTELMAAPEPDREAIAVQLGEIARLREQMDKRVVEHFLSIKALLGPDQQDAFNEAIRRAFSRGGRGHPGFGGPYGPHQGRGRGRGGPFHNGED